MWNDLTMQQRADVISMAVKAGIRDIDSIKSFYEESIGSGRFRSEEALPMVTVEPKKFDKGSYLDIAKSHIRKNEGWSPKPVADGPKNTGWRSVGYGFNDSGFRAKYPQGISKAYENGITKAQAEQELDYIIRNMDSHLKKVYGSKWNSFNDNQKAAILDTYYQRPASVVGKKSAFYNAVMRGDKNAGSYLGVSGFTQRNNDRRKLFGNTKIEEPIVLPVSQNTNIKNSNLIESVLDTQNSDRSPIGNSNNPIRLPELTVKLDSQSQKETPLIPEFQAVPQFSDFALPLLNSGRLDKEEIQQPIVPAYQHPYSIYDLYDTYWKNLGISYEKGGYLDEKETVKPRRFEVGGHLYPGEEGDNDPAAESAAEIAIGMIPVVGAGYDIYQAYKDPSPSNILIAGTSTLLDIANLLSEGTATLPVAAAKGFIKGVGRGVGRGVVKGAVKEAVKKTVVKHAVPTIERGLAGTGRVTNSMHRQAVRTANQNAKKILVKDLKEDAKQQASFTLGQELFQTKDGKFVWQK